MRKIIVFLHVFAIAFLIACTGAPSSSPVPETEGSMKLFSPAFQDNGVIPQKYAYSFENLSPPLNWEGAPQGTKSFALDCVDPDAPSGHFVHWVAWDIPSALSQIEEGQPKTEVLANGIIQGVNDFGRIGWDGPNPPSGTHHYIFTLYALDIDLGNALIGALHPGKSNRDDLMEVIDGHILAKATLTGTFSK